MISAANTFLRNYLYKLMITLISQALFTHFKKFKKFCGYISLFIDHLFIFAFLQIIIPVSLKVYQIAHFKQYFVLN